MYRHWLDLLEARFHERSFLPWDCSSGVEAGLAKSWTQASEQSDSCWCLKEGTWTSCSETWFTWDTPGNARWRPYDSGQRGTHQLAEIRRGCVDEKIDQTCFFAENKNPWWDKAEPSTQAFASSWSYCQQLYLGRTLRATEKLCHSEKWGRWLVLFCSHRQCCGPAYFSKYRKWWTMGLKFAWLEDAENMTSHLSVYVWRKLVK